MKLQLTSQSLRLRLDEAELPAFNQTGQLTQALDLGSGQLLTYALHRLAADAPAEGLRVRYAADVLTVEVPATLARQLIEGATVSLRGETLGTDGQPIRILVERDLGSSH